MSNVIYYDFKKAKKKEYKKPKVLGGVIISAPGQPDATFFMTGNRAANLPCDIAFNPEFSPSLFSRA